MFTQVIDNVCRDAHHMDSRLITDCPHAMTPSTMGRGLAQHSATITDSHELLDKVTAWEPSV